MHSYTKLVENRGQLCCAYVADICSDSFGVKDHPCIAMRVISLLGSELNLGRTLLISVRDEWAHKGTFVGVFCYFEL